MVTTYQTTFKTKPTLTRGEASYTSLNTMEYQEYLFAQLLSIYDEEFKEMPYDDQYELVPQLYEDFFNSKFNDTLKGEYDCIVNYLSANQHKKVKLGDEIVESLKQFDGINAEVWNYVSDKLGYTQK